MGRRSQKKLKQKHLSFRESMEAYDNKPLTPQALRKIELDRQKEALDRDREEAYLRCCSKTRSNQKRY